MVYRDLERARSIAKSLAAVPQVLLWQSSQEGQHWGPDIDAWITIIATALAAEREDPTPAAPPTPTDPAHTPGSTH